MPIRVDNIFTALPEALAKNSFSGCSKISLSKLSVLFLIPIRALPVFGTINLKMSG